MLSEALARRDGLIRHVDASYLTKSAFFDDSYNQLPFDICNFRGNGRLYSLVAAFASYLASYIDDKYLLADVHWKMKKLAVSREW